MWPHSITIGLGGTAVVVASDDSSIVEELGPWSVDVERSVVDLALETTPAQPAERSAPRTLPNLRHGSDRIATSPDVAMLRAALMRMLAAHGSRHATGFLRLPGMVLVREGRATVVPLGGARFVAHRQFRRLGFDPVYAQSVLIDVAAVEAVIDAPLGSTESPRRLPLETLFLFHREPDAPVTRGTVVARLLGNALGEVALHDAVVLVGRVPVRCIASGREALEKALTAP